MFTHRTDIAECVIHNEIKDWFSKIIIDTCGPDVHLRYKSNDAHINTATYVEISGSETQISAAFVLIEKISETLQYRMPWLQGNPYYVRNEEDQETVQENLKSFKNVFYDLCSTDYNVIGYRFILFGFRPDLDDDTEKAMDQIFKALPQYISPFITYPESRLPMKKSTSYITTKMLAELHGEFLPYLSLEDVLSLEMANSNENIPYDTALHQDIQKHLRDYYVEFYEGDQIDDADLLDFKINSVLLYCIHKYHDRFKKITISNILTADEINALIDSYNIEIENQSIVHIDFKSRNELGIIDCCAMYHFDPIGSFIPNYDPKYITENHTLHFKEDDSLDVSNDTNEFSYLILKSDTACSSQKTNSILEYVTEHFKAGSQDESRLTLSEFNLSCVSNENLSLLLNMMRDGTLELEKINFELANFMAILTQSKQNRLEFKKCYIDVAQVEIIPNDSEIGHLRFSDMDIELKVLVGLQNISELELINCQILCNNWLVPCNKKPSDTIKIAFTRFDIGTLLKLLNGLECIPIIHFLLCDITDCDTPDKIYFTVRNIVTFSNMKLNLQILLQVFENCEFQNRIVFDDCEFYFGTNAMRYFQLKPVQVQFFHIQFDPVVLITILETLNSKSAVMLSDCDILSDEEIDHTSDKVIKIERVQLSRCKLDTQILFSILRKVSKKSKLGFDACELAGSIAEYSNISTNVSKLIFANMKISALDLCNILSIMKENSYIAFHICEIVTKSEVITTTKQPNKIKICFRNTTIESEIVRYLLQYDVEITFNSCTLNFMTDPALKMPIKSQILFRNMTIDLSTHLKTLANFIPASKLEFVHCHFHVSKLFLIHSNDVLHSSDIQFKRSTFDLEALIIMLEKMSTQTIVDCDNCIVLSITHMFSIAPVRIQGAHFKSMDFDLKTILSIFKNTVKLLNLGFNNCKILCSNPIELDSTKLRVEILLFHDMEIDVGMMQTFAQRCDDGTSVYFNNCTFVSMPSKTISIVPVNIKFLICHNVKYSPELLQMLQSLDGEFIFQYKGELSIQQIIEICTKTTVQGNRFSLLMDVVSPTLHFELLEEYFRSIAFNTDLNIERQYDLPMHLLPEINNTPINTQYWSEYKVKFSYINSASVKLEFIKKGEPIDIFYEANNISVDSDEYIIDHSYQ